MPQFTLEAVSVIDPTSNMILIYRTFKIQLVTPPLDPDLCGQQKRHPIRADSMTFDLLPPSFLPAPTAPAVPPVFDGLAW